MLDKSISALDAAADAIGRLGAWFVLIHVLLVAGNVLLRYLFSAGAVWAQELEWHLLAPIIVFGIPYAIARGDIVRIDSLYDKLPETLRTMIDLISAIALSAMCVFLAHISFEYAYTAYVTGENSPNPQGLPYRFIIKSLVPLVFVMLFLQGVSLALKAIRQFRTLRHRDPARSHI